MVKLGCDDEIVIVPEHIYSSQNGNNFLDIRICFMKSEHVKPAHIFAEF